MILFEPSINPIKVDFILLLVEMRILNFYSDKPGPQAQSCLALRLMISNNSTTVFSIYIFLM